MLKVFRDLELEFGRYPLPLEVSFVEKSDLIEAVLDVSWSFGSAQAAEKNSCRDDQDNFSIRRSYNICQILDSILECSP